MSQYKNPTWWTNEHDSAWERVKAAFKRDWDQTKHDLGGDEPDTDQDVDNTVKQAAGKEAIPPRGEPAYEELGPAYRFGYGARAHLNEKYSEWDEELEERLKKDWTTSNPSRASSWKRDAEAIRHGWDYYE